MAKKRRRKSSKAGLTAVLAVVVSAIALVLMLVAWNALGGSRIRRAANASAGNSESAATGSVAATTAAAAADEGDKVTGTIFDPTDGSRTYGTTAGTQAAAPSAGASGDQSADVQAAGADGQTAAPAADAAASTASTASTAASTASEASASTASETTSNVVYVMTSDVNVRSGPGTDSEVLGQAVYGSAYEKKGEEGEWTNILYSGKSAWIKSEFISSEKPSAKEWNLDDLDNEQVNFGYSSANRDENNIPTDWEWYESKWGQFDVDFIQDTSKKTIYLTMDEGFGNDNTITILDTLRDKGVKVTFFITKNFLDERPELVQRMLDEGHQIGNHTCTHPNMPSKGIEEETNQIMNLHDMVKDQFGYEMNLFRYPEGVFSNQSLGLVNNLGYKAVFWSYAYGDYDEQNQPPVDESLQKALDALHPGAIYLLHASSDTNTAFLGDFIDGARERGFEFASSYPA